MIDWSTSLACAAALTSQPARTTSALKEAARGTPVFQNRTFPLSPLPLLLRQSCAQPWARDVEAYVRLLNKIVALFVDEPAVRSWYALGPAAERLVAADRNLQGEVVVCRLDGYLRQGSEVPRLLENNADAPAGSLFTGRINRLILDVLDRLDISLSVLSPLTYLNERALLDTLLARAPDARHVAILQLAGSVTAESAAMAELFTGTGIDAFVADPRSVRTVGDRVYFGECPADACWNKLNTAPWLTIIGDDSDLVDRWVRAVSSPSFIHVNPFGARYVAENKLSLALPHEPQFEHLFSGEEHALIARLLPWASRVTEDLCERLTEEQHAWVLKQPYDIRGDGVTVGRVTSRSEWHQAVRGAIDNGHLAQQYVPPAAYPILQEGSPAVVPMSISLDTFVLNGQVHGFGSKASLNALVNVFQGGQKLAVHVVADGPA